MAFDDQPKVPGSYGELGDALEPSPTKAIIGVAIMVVLGFVLYQVNGTSGSNQTSLATPPVSQNVANNNTR